MNTKTAGPLTKSLTRFLVSGVCAFVAEYLSFVVLYYVLNIGLVVANGLSFVLGLGTSFSLNRNWTFSFKQYKKTKSHQLLYYIGLALFNLLTTLLLVSFLKYLGLEPKF